MTLTDAGRPPLMPADTQALAPNATGAADVIGGLALDTVHCGDALDFLRGLPDGSVDLVASDLPYGTTNCAWDTIIPFEPMWAELKRIVKPRAAIVLTASQPFTSALVMSNLEMFRYELIVDKALPTGFLDANVKPLKVHENVLVFGVNATDYFPQMRDDGTPYAKMRSSNMQHYGKHERMAGASDGQRFPTSILRFSFADHTNVLHPTQKPVALFEYLIRTYSREGDVVVDMTCGSGTTGLAARNCGRHYLLNDNSPAYVAIARDRLRLPFEPRQIEADNDVSGLPLFDLLADLQAEAQS